MNGIVTRAFTAEHLAAICLQVGRPKDYDRVISMRSGRRLFDSLPATAPVKWSEVSGADYDDVLITAYPIYAEIADWMLRHVPAK